MEKDDAGAASCGFFAAHGQGGNKYVLPISQALDLFIRNEEDAQWVQAAARLAERFAKRAVAHDRAGSFPFDNYKDLVSEGFHLLTVPKQYGGFEASLYTFLLVQETLAKADASTALGFGWHAGLMLNLRASQGWPQSLLEAICRDVAQHGRWLNAYSTEPTSGSPSRGRGHLTQGKRTADGWVLNGHKTWSSISPLADYLIITATVADTGNTGEFIVPRHTPGVSVIETWDSLGMRATGSHDIVLEEVALPPEALIEQHPAGQPSPKGRDGGGWMLHIPACYLGIAAAARSCAVTFARTYVPRGSQQSIAAIPSVSDRLGRLESELYAARSILYQTAALWDSRPSQWMALRPQLAAAKYKVTNQAVEIVDLAMRIVGGRSMLKDLPLERYYRDVRGGLHNPPMDDVAIKMMAEYGQQDHEWSPWGDA